MEGGSFCETFRSSLVHEKNNLPAEFNGARNSSTAIYFLLEFGQFSAFHKIASDEVWHFYEGETLTIYEINIDGLLTVHKLGRKIDFGETYQCVIKAGNWFASRCEVENGFSLVGCTVSPGFDFADFELANGDELSKVYPNYQNLISQLTRS